MGVRGLLGAGRQIVDAEPTTYCVALLAMGAVLLIVAANGLRVARLSRDGLEFPVPSEDQVLDDALHAKAPDEVLTLPPPAAVAAPGATFTQNDDEYQVFEPEDIPAKVIEDLMRAPQPVIKSLSDVAYGFRRIGQGNHAWFVTTRGGVTQQVSYGGRGKSDASVKAAETRV